MEREMKTNKATVKCNEVCNLELVISHGFKLA